MTGRIGCAAIWTATLAMSECSEDDSGDSDSDSNVSYSVAAVVQTVAVLAQYLRSYCIKVPRNISTLQDPQYYRKLFESNIEMRLYDIARMGEKTLFPLFRV